MKGVVGISLGLLLALGARSARAEAPVGTPPPAPAGATPDTAATAPPSAPDNAAGPTAAVPAPPPTQNQTTLTVGLPQPSVRPINHDLGIGVALTYVSIPLVFVSGGVMAVGFLVDSDGAKVTGIVMTGASLALFGVGVGFLVSGSEQGPQPQKSSSTGTRQRFELRPPLEREADVPESGFVAPVISGSF